MGGSIPAGSSSTPERPHRKPLPATYDRASIVIDVDDEVDLTDEEIEELEREEEVRSDRGAAVGDQELPAFSLEASRPLSPPAASTGELPAFTFDGSLGLPPVIDKEVALSVDQVPPYLRSSAPPPLPGSRSSISPLVSDGTNLLRREVPAAPLRTDRPARRPSGSPLPDPALPLPSLESGPADDEYSVPGLNERELRGYAEQPHSFEAPVRPDGSLSEPLPSLDGPHSEPLPSLDGPHSEPLPSLDGPHSEPLPSLDGPHSEPLPRLTLDSIEPIEELDAELVELDAEEIEEVDLSSEVGPELAVPDLLVRDPAPVLLPGNSPLPPPPVPELPLSPVPEQAPLRPALDSISDEVTPPRGSPVPDSVRVQFSSPSDLLEAAMRVSEERKQRELQRDDGTAESVAPAGAEFAMDESPAVLPPVVTKSARPAPSLESQSIEGVDLTQVRGLSDLSDSGRRHLMESVRVEELAAGEEVCFFSVALVIRGWVSLMPAIADAACASAVVGEVVFTEGTLPEPVALRAVAGEGKTRVAVWDSEAVQRATEDCTWMRDELRLMGDGFQALAGAALGPLGERLDDALRSMVTARCEVRALSKHQVLVGAGRPVPGLHIVGAGEVELVDANGGVVSVHGAGEFLFAVQVLAGGPAPLSARAGEAGALVLFTPRMVAHELLVSVPPLLELLGE